MSAVKFLLNLCAAAVEKYTNTGTRFSTLLSSVCSYQTFPFADWDDPVDKSDFLLDLFSHVKKYEIQTGRSFIPGLKVSFPVSTCCLAHFSLREKDLCPSGSAETPNREETSRAVI